MHHKRKRPKDRRAGCLLCKPWKSNCLKGKRRRAKTSSTWKDIKRQDLRSNVSFRHQLRETAML